MGSGPGTTDSLGHMIKKGVLRYGGSQNQGYRFGGSDTFWGL